ncbi:MAG TPA: hypothetical protein VKV24_19460 [Casimicrobiaceae bacterium]|nr:hypothetical protein [Casimicrobiaceae bacterium]
MARYRSIERPPAGRTVQIEVAGVRYEATYTVDGPIVTVDSLLLGHRSAALGDGSAEVVAKVLLLELVYSHERRSA